MGLEFLVRVRNTTLWLAGVGALLVASYLSPRLGLALAAGAAWSLVNLSLIERLITALTSRERVTFACRNRAALAIAGLVVLFASGAALLALLPAPWLMAGFGVPLVVMVSKAVSALLLMTGAWARLTKSPWRAALVAIAIGGLAWLAVSALPGHPSAALHAAPPAHASAATHEEQKAPGFPTVVTLLEATMPHAGWVAWVVKDEVLLFSMLIALLLCVAAYFASRNAKMIPGPLQNVVETLVEKLYDFIVGILGPRYGPRYVPFLGTLFIYILAMNLFGLIPFMHSPTASLNVTVALALTVFVYVQYTGLRELGVPGYFHHLLGSPRDVTSWLLTPLMLPIHILGELAKPISLSCRLFGNVFGEDMLLVAFATLGVMCLPVKQLPFGLPLQFPLFLGLAIFSSVLQALVFTVLSTVYILLMLPHEEHGHEGEAHPAH
ncbi:MAG: F0F1 ATP synthase subunit A [Candidatus Eisenbacteria bacterium]|nr:F0F1 ATP synthase subunit A [Candidatus Eisenbacteria bacterium]